MTTHEDQINKPRLNVSLAELRAELGSNLRQAEQVQPPAGLPTGWTGLDRYLLWHGFPKSAISLLIGESGGATSLWTRCATGVTKQKQWVAWMDDSHGFLTPWSLRHRQVELSRFLYVSPPTDLPQLLWALQELMSLGLFELIGCSLGDIQLKDHHILKLKRLALRYQTALVFITHQPPRRLSAFYSLILEFKRDHVYVRRALHRPTPYTLERRDLYADTLPQLAAGRRALCG